MKAISPPPKFVFTANERTLLPPPNGINARASTPKSRGRPRGASPAKNGSPSKQSTKKPRATKAAKEADAASAREASATLQATLDHTTPDDTSVAEPASTDGEKVTIRVDSNVDVKGDKEREETTTVKIEMPAGVPELPLPERPEEMIETARAMVAEARKVEGESSSSKGKRKAEEMDEDSDGSADTEVQPAKKARLLGEELKKEKVRNRALLGVVATLAVGYVHMKVFDSRLKIANIQNQSYNPLCTAQLRGSASIDGRFAEVSRFVLTGFEHRVPSGVVKFLLLLIIPCCTVEYLLRQALEGSSLVVRGIFQFV